MRQVKEYVFQPGKRGHPDQEFYILVWQDLCENLPAWVKSFQFLTGAAEVLPLKLHQKEEEKRWSPVLPESQADLLTMDSLPPYPQAFLRNPAFPRIAPSPQPHLPFPLSVTNLFFPPGCLFNDQRGGTITGESTTAVGYFDPGSTLAFGTPSVGAGERGDGLGGRADPGNPE